MNRIIALLCLGFLTHGCLNKSGGGGGGSSSEATVEPLPTKPLFDKWTNELISYDFTGGEFNKNLVMVIVLPTSQIWIDALNASDRDTTGLLAGEYNFCVMSIFIVGTDKFGNMATNHDNDADTPHNNACLEWDSNCSIGPCNFDADHLYASSNDILVIDYFGEADKGRYSMEYLQ